jgi:phosphotransacetylase
MAVLARARLAPRVCLRQFSSSRASQADFTHAVRLSPHTITRLTHQYISDGPLQLTPVITDHRRRRRGPRHSATALAAILVVFGAD